MPIHSRACIWKDTSQQIVKCHSVDFRVASVRIAIVFRHGKAKIVRRSEVRYCWTKKASAKHLNKLIARKGKKVERRLH